MEVVRQLTEIKERYRGGAVTIGNFDGVHRGHARLIAMLKKAAERCGGPAVVFTFDPHPVRILRPDAVPPPLTWTERKADLLQELGVDVLVVYPTDEALLRLEPEAFFAEVILKILGARAMVEGPNFFFGRDRAGDVERLAELCQEHELTLQVVEPLQDGGSFVSSSRVRDLVQQGDLAQVCQLLTQPYRIRGMVTHGAGRGARLGIPTANIGAVDTLLPNHGVYAGSAYVRSQRWPAAINIGPNPTFGEGAEKVEAHLIGFHGSLYGQPLEVDFLTRLRDIRPFADVAQLKEQLQLDLAETERVYLEQQSGPQD